LRAIFLNSWFGMAGKPFFDFVKSESTNADIFCFMEFTPEFFDKVSEILPGYRGFIEKGTVLEPLGLTNCQVIFVRKKLEIVTSGRLKLYRNTSSDVGFAAYIIFKDQGKIVNLLNIHGKSIPGHKLDTPARLKQSKIIINFFKDKDGAKIIGGDFNLMPEARSIAMFEKTGYKNLTREFGIKNTRNKISWKKFNDTQRFADYVFVSKDVKVIGFEVPYNEISDHLPQILDFEI
jgi:endonuclease/exonuclease/phosphatase (EEP) superfamily protein YafD